jgi:RNA polymerase sigma-70 factor (ECF subfamily)
VKLDSTCLDPTAALILTGALPPQTGIRDMSGKEDESGSAAIFWELLAPVHRRVYNYIRKSLGFSQDADDVFQESVLQAFRYFRTYRRGAKFETWLFSIAHNEVRKHFRRASKVNVPLDVVRPALPDSTRTNELVREVYRFARTLNPRQREVFFLFYDSGFSIGEISEITGLREGNIRFILSQARTNLKTLMGEKDERR